MELEPMVAPTKTKQHMASGHRQSYVTWKVLNRLRTGVGRCKPNMMKWGFSKTDRCDCGEVQTMAHLLTCGGEECTEDDLREGNDVAMTVAKRWQDVI